VGPPRSACPVVLCFFDPATSLPPPPPGVVFLFSPLPFPKFGGESPNVALPNGFFFMDPGPLGPCGWDVSQIGMVETRPPPLVVPHTVPPPTRRRTLAQNYTNPGTYHLILVLRTSSTGSVERSPPNPTKTESTETGRADRPPQIQYTTGAFRVSHSLRAHVPPGKPSHWFFPTEPIGAVFG